MLRVECRHSDIVGRLGGEEFALRRAGNLAADARSALAERIREACQRLVLMADSGEVRCSCSIGVTETAPDDDGIERVLQRADAALYEAKRSGRDCWRSQHPRARVPASQPLTLRRTASAAAWRADSSSGWNHPSVRRPIESCGRL